eukprot:scaffold271_cov336-Pavlova_lutheri.AAC.26
MGNALPHKELARWESFHGLAELFRFFRQVHGQRLVWHDSHTLDVFPVWCQVLGCGDQHSATVAELHNRLHPGLAVGAVTHDAGPSVVVQGCREDLRRAGRAFVHQQGNGHVGRHDERVWIIRIQDVPHTLCIGHPYDFAGSQQIPGQFHARRKAPARVSPEVHHQSLCASFHGFAYGFSGTCIALERPNVHIGQGVSRTDRSIHRLQVHHCTHQLQGLLFALFAHLQHGLAPWFAT